MTTASSDDGHGDTQPASTAEASQDDDSDFLALLQDVAAARPKGDEEELELPVRGEVLEGDFEVLSALGSGGCFWQGCWRRPSERW